MFYDMNAPRVEREKAFKRILSMERVLNKVMRNHKSFLDIKGIKNVDDYQAYLLEFRSQPKIEKVRLSSMVNVLRKVRLFMDDYSFKGPLNVSGIEDVPDALRVEAFKQDNGFVMNLRYQPIREVGMIEMCRIVKGEEVPVQTISFSVDKSIDDSGVTIGAINLYDDLNLYPLLSEVLSNVKFTMVDNIGLATETGLSVNDLSDRHILHKIGVLDDYVAMEVICNLSKKSYGSLSNVHGPYDKGM